MTFGSVTTLLKSALKSVFKWALEKNIHGVMNVTFQINIIVHRAKFNKFKCMGIYKPWNYRNLSTLYTDSHLAWTPRRRSCYVIIVWLFTASMVRLSSCSVTFVGSFSVTRWGWAWTWLSSGPARPIRLLTAGPRLWCCGQTGSVGCLTAGRERRHSWWRASSEPVSRRLKLHVQTSDLNKNRSIRLLE